MIPWSPLARGRLTRPWNEATTRTEIDDFGRPLYRPADAEVVAAVQEVAAERGVSMAQIGLAWVMAQPGITSPIVGLTKPQHLADAVAAVDVELSDDEVAALSAPYVPHSIAGHQ